MASRRAAGRLRRYVAANRLNRLGTLTYAEACWDPRRARSDVGAFFRALRGEIGRAFPYLWVPEWHPGGHGLHLHFAVGRYVPQGLIASSWGRGIVDIRRRDPQRFGAGPVDEARQTAAYLAKYVSKGFAEGDRPAGLHRFDVAQGFRPVSVRVAGRSEAEIIARASARMGAQPVYVWRSAEARDWYGPPAVWMQWGG